MSRTNNFDPNSEEQYIGGEIFPPVPFQIFINDSNYAERYNLPLKKFLTVTDVRYVIAKRHIRYNLREAIFDFPWNENSIQKVTTYSTN